MTQSEKAVDLWWRKGITTDAADGLKVPAVIPEGTITHAEALSAFEQLRSQAADVQEMTPDEINAEISGARAERKARQ